MVKVGEYSHNEWKNKMELNINLEYVLWPGGSKEKPLGFVIPKHLKVSGSTSANRSEDLLFTADVGGSSRGDAV